MPLQLQLWRGPDHHLPALPTPVTPSEQSARQSLLQQAAALMSPADPGPVPAQGLREEPVSSRGRRAPAPGPACLDPLTSSPFRPTPLSLATTAQVERATHGTPGSSTHGHAVQGLRASLSPAPEAWLRSVLPFVAGHMRYALQVCRRDTGTSLPLGAFLQLACLRTRFSGSPR